MMMTLVRAGSGPVGHPVGLSVAWPVGRWRARVLRLPVGALLAVLPHSRAHEEPHDPPHARADAARLVPPGQTEFDAFFARYQQPLYGYLRRLVPADDLATDLAQEAFFRAWRHFAEVSAYERPAAWLFRVATNLAISHLRRRLPLSLAHFARAPLHDPDASNPGTDDERLVDPGDFATASVERDLINALLARLPERQRAALLLRAVQGFSCDEIAETLEVSSVAARKTLSRARERFRELYLAAQREGT
jgi:RNA polymerase sigma-70 factor (ECF subfamily)